MRSRRAALGVVVAVTVLAATACTPAQAPAGSSTPSEEPTAEPTTLAAYDTEGVAVARAPFCDRVSPTGIEHALGATARSHRDYGNGDRIRLGDDSRTISHEYGCEWRGPGGTTARGWVFVPPISRSRARQLVADAQEGRCERTGTGQFGTPSVATTCRTPDGVERSWRGLFGDAWLVCTLSGRRAGQVSEDRTGEWCVSVLDAARA